MIVRSHTVRPGDKNVIKLKDCYKSCLQNVLTYDVKSIAFCCVATSICGFDQRKAAEIALATVRFWLESNHFSGDHVIFVHVKMQTMKYIKICHTGLVLFTIIYRLYEQTRTSCWRSSYEIRDLFREIETSNEPVKTSNDMRYLNLQRYEPGMQYNAHDLEKQKGKLTIVQEEEKIDSSKVKL